MSENITFHDLTQTGTNPEGLLQRTESDLSVFFERVKPIIERVRTEGDAALRHFAQAFDGVTAPEMSIRATPEEFDAPDAVKVGGCSPHCCPYTPLPTGEKD